MYLPRNNRFCHLWQYFSGGLDSYLQHWWAYYWSLPSQLIISVSSCWHTWCMFMSLLRMMMMSELSVGILTILAMIYTIWWQSQHMSYIDFVHLAAYHSQCVSSSYLKLPLNVWMLLSQLGKKHDLLFLYLIFQCLCHSFPSQWQNLMLTCCSRFSSSVLSNPLTHSTFFTDSSCPLVKWQLNSPSNCVWVGYAHLDMTEHF